MFSSQHGGPLASSLERKRTEWKSGALDRIANLSITNQIIRQEIDELKISATKTDPNEFAWTGDHVLLMADGDYIIYEYRHGRNDYFPPHLFLGRSADGQWLYSSFHFCNSMAMIRFEKQPTSINNFAKKYFARAFDGKSNVCLDLTQ